MRKIVVSEFVSLDGVMEDPGGSEQFKHGGWTGKYWHAEIGHFKFEELFASDALLLGRVTYQGFAAAWPSIKDEQGFADRMNGLPKYVVSTTLNKLEWNNSTLIRENVVEEVAKLKQQPGQNILIFGSGALVHTLMQRGLIDEYQILVYPVVLGSGKSFFKGFDERVPLKLVEAKTFASGVVALSYQPA
ncbi:MAG: dihydrofolate reductase family protein [Ktedonobacteraceae bacterium]